MKFGDFNKLLQNHFKTMCENTTQLFTVDVDKELMWETYLENFPKEYNRIFRERREHDCSCCKNFIRNFGNVVVIKDNQVISLWDFFLEDEEFSPSVKAMSELIHSKSIDSVRVQIDKKVGTERNFEKTVDKILEWEHLYLEVPSPLIYKGNSSIGEKTGYENQTRDVFKRSLDEITTDSVETVLELISQNSLYRGKEWEEVLKIFLSMKKEYEALSSEMEKVNYAWSNYTKGGISVSKIKNHSMGVLLIDISENMPLDKAVTRYENIVAPSNYKRPQAVYTKKMLEQAKEKLEELGFMESLPRKYAELSDISINNVLYSNKDVAKSMQGGDIFAEMSEDLVISPKKFSKVEEIKIEDFITDILPTAREIEVLLENKHSPNMVSLIAPQNPNSKTMFKWNNNFGWAYSGNITDSSMKENVKNAGGNIEGVLRFSIQWNEENRLDNSDLDAHCIEPNGYEIYFRNSGCISPTGGMLDVDITSPVGVAVENIFWENTSRMDNGNYSFAVHNYSDGGNKGFKAEIEFNGQIYSFDYKQSIPTGKTIKVAVVNFKNGEFSIKENISSSMSSKEVWGLKTQSFVPVYAIMNSPNYWDSQDNIGNKHYFFMLKDCVNPETPNGFYNEFLSNELTEHRKVFEALGSRMAVQNSDNQLSGLGFSETKRNELIVKVKTVNIDKTLKVKF